MQRRHKTIGIVLESAEPALVDRWCSEGKLPVLQRLREEGVWALLRSPAYISSGCAWPTLNVGTNPAKHGIGFFHREIKNGSYQIIKKYADNVHGEPFWHRLGRAGFRNVIFDLAATLPSPQTHGAIVVDWGSEHPAWKPSSYPAGLFDEVTRRIGRHPLAHWYQHKLETKEDCRAIADKIILGVKLRTRALQFILAKEDFDFVFCNYSEPHWAGHIFWHLHDVRHPEHMPEHAAYCGDVIEQTYKACDRAIGELTEAYPGANIVVMSNIGMGSHAGGDMMVPEVLERLGMSAEPRGNNPIRRALQQLLPGRSGQVMATQQVERWLGAATIARIRRVVPQRMWDTWTRRFLGIGSNWAGSRAFLLPGDNSSLIRINLQGREPQGRVRPGTEYRLLCAELAAAFMELINPVTGEAAVEKVVIVHEHLKGDRIDQMPDLAIVWKNIGAPLQALESPRIGRVNIRVFNKRSGGHLHDGFFIGNGPNFRNGVSLEKRDLTDVAPTILALFGVHAPDYMDGDVMTGAMR